MRINFNLKSKIPMDVEPTDTVKATRDKLEAMILKNLEKQGEDITEVDLTLTFKDVVLEEEQTLEACGIVEGSIIHVLSQTLAQLHAAKSGVFCVRQAFKDLAKKGIAGPEAEAEALSHAPLFPLMCDVNDLGELGAGWVLFFRFVQFLGCLCVVLFVLQLPAFFSYRSFDRSDLLLWKNHTYVRKDKPISWDYITAGNTGPEGDASYWPVVSGLLTSVVMIFVVPQWARQQYKIQVDIDKREVHPDDFGLLIEGLPSDATEDKIRKFVVEQALPEEKTEVVIVVVSYDITKFRDMLAKLKEAKAELAQASDERARALLQAKVKELATPWTSSDALRGELSCTGTAVVVLRSQEEHRKVLDEWDTPCDWVRDFFPVTCYCLSSWSCLQVDRPLFEEKHVLRISRAANPSDMLWENMDVPLLERAKARAKSYANVVLIFGVCLLVVVGLNKLSDRMGNPALLNLLPSIAIIFIRIFASRRIRKYVALQKHKTKTIRDVSILSKLALFYVLSYCVVAVLVNLNPFEGDWYTEGGLVSDISNLMIMNCITIPLTIISGAKVCMRRCLRDRKLDVKNPPPGLNQKKLEILFEPPDMDQPRTFAKVLITFLLGFLFMPMWPYAILTSAVVLFIEYWAFKYELLRQSKRPYRQSKEVSYAALRILYVGVAIFPGLQALFLTPSLAQNARVFSAGIVAPLVLIPIGLMLLPSKWKRLLCGGFLFSVEKESTHTDTDYYQAQKSWAKHQKYHTTNEIYLNAFEMMNMRAKKPIWDSRTGNIKEPEPVDRPVPATSSTGPLPVGSMSAGAGPDVGSLSKTSLSGLMGKEEAEAAGEASEGSEDEEEDEAAEEPGPIADVDPAVLAMEEMKHKLPTSMLGGDETTDDESELSSSEGSGSDDDDIEMGKPLGLRPGAVARIAGLEDPKAMKFNGLDCTIDDWSATSRKWLVTISLDSGEEQKARMAAQNLEQKVRIVHLKKKSADEFNNTVATIIGYNDKAGKWNVRLFTGVVATIPTVNLRPM